MTKDTINVNMNVYDIPIVIEELEKANKEIERLNNIMNELEKWSNKVLEIYNNVDIKTLLMVKDKLKELKENK